ncbi:hypothetical protein MJL79_31665, partial [Salmonella enterica subsp. enterica serovar Montevideo]|nr:hypothetical protein [Salmonella enterica subsp. enterica serovar Montevideo]
MPLEKGIAELVAGFIAAGRPSSREQNIDDRRRKMTRRFHTERQLAMFLVLAAVALSTFLTNDVALFIVVPLT